MGGTAVEAHAMRDRFDRLVHHDNGIASLSNSLGFDVSGFDPDGPLPRAPEANASKTARERVLALARETQATIRQLTRKVGSYSGLAFVGTARTIADEMEHWLLTEASDGFNVMFPFLPAGCIEGVSRAA